MMSSLLQPNNIGSEVYGSKLAAEQNPTQIPDETLSGGVHEKRCFSGLGRKVFTEVIATFLLVFVTCGTAAISANDQNAISKLGASLAGGLIVTVMIYAVGHISGAHMNPAVTLAFASALRFPWKHVPFYWVAQLTGAATASFLLRELLRPITDLGTTTPSNTAFQALVMEIAVTFCMMFVTSAVATDTKAIGELAGIAVGSSVCITSILAGPVSGGSMNPARTLGPALASQKYDALWVYIVGPVCGTLLGAWSYRLIRDTDEALPSTGSSSLKLRQQQTDTNKLVSQKHPMDDVC